MIIIENGNNTSDHTDNDNDEDNNNNNNSDNDENNDPIQSAMDSPKKDHWFCAFYVFFVVSLSKLLKQSSCWCWKHHHVLFCIYFHQNSKFTHKF